MSWYMPSTDLGTHICIKLVNLVKQYPVIYLSSKEQSLHPRKNRNEINQIWEDIAANIGLSVEDSKRRWKGLKDVYAKIRKRRLQEGVLGIKARKKWLYEDIMSFMKFPFEQLYQKALENFEEVDCNDWKLDDQDCSNDTGEETLTESNDHLVITNSNIKEQPKIDKQEQIKDEAIEYLDLDLEVDFVPDSEGYESVQSFKKEDRYGGDSLDDRTYFKASIRGKNSGTEVKRQFRFRATRPKPYQPNLLSKNRSFKNGDVVKNITGSMPPDVKGSNLNSLNQRIVTHLTTKLQQRGKNCDTVMFASSNDKVNDYGKETSDDVSSTSPVRIRIESFKSTKMNSSFASNTSQSLLHVASKKTSCSSLELFFESMAQTVMNLPMRVQAEIKMEICRIVTRAEIQHSLSQSTSKLEFRTRKSKKG